MDRRERKKDSELKKTGDRFAMIALGKRSGKRSKLSAQDANCSSAATAKTSSMADTCHNARDNVSENTETLA